MLSGRDAVANLFVVGTFRTKDHHAPPRQSLPQQPAMQAEATAFDLNGVEAIISSSFGAAVNRCSTLSALLLAETGGYPLHLTSLLSILVGRIRWWS